MSRRRTPKLLPPSTGQTEKETMSKQRLTTGSSNIATDKRTIQKSCIRKQPYCLTTLSVFNKWFCFGYRMRCPPVCQTVKSARTIHSIWVFMSLVFYQKFKWPLKINSKRKIAYCLFYSNIKRQNDVKRIRSIVTNMEEEFCKGTSYDDGILVVKCRVTSNCVFNGNPSR
jgi:hypothetical protein